MRPLALLALVSLTAFAQGRFDRFNARTNQGRSDRGFDSSGAFFEAFPASGAGTSGVCSTTAPTGAKGETLTFTRASSATCTKTATGGLATTGIADGDLVVLSSNVARVEYDSAGVLGLLVEAARTNVLLRYIEYANAAWADVGTPTLTGSQTDPFGATNAVQFDDNDGAAYEGRSQSVTVSAGAAYTAHCYVKAGTLAKARITLDGTAATITGLSTSTWSIVQVTDASSSGVSIAFQALNGDATTDTGTVIWGGCQVEAGSYRTSITPTAGATVMRAVESASVTFSPAMSATAGSHAASFTSGWSTGPASSVLHFLRYDASAQPLYFVTAGSTLRTWDGSSELIIVTSFTAGTAKRMWSSYAASTQTLNNGTSSTTGSFDGTFGSGALTTMSIGGSATAVDGILSRICVDPDPTRCR